MARKPSDDGKPGRKRRGRGEGGICQRPDGLWVGSVSLGYAHDGKRNRKRLYGKTKGEVIAKIDELKAAARAGSLPDAGAMTVGQLLDRWLANSESRNSDRTKEERERVVRLHLKPAIGAVKLAKLTPLHVEGLYADMRAAKKGAHVTRTAADLLSIALNYAVRLGLIRSNPAASASVAKPKAPKREMLFLNAAQVKALLSATVGRTIFPLVATALGTGLRSGELLALSWEDIDLRKRTLRVRKALSRTRSGYVLKEPKTEHSRRSVALPDFAVKALEEFRERKSKSLEHPVFSTREGNYLDRKNVLRAFRAAVAATNKKLPAGVPALPTRLRVHDLRHTVASLLLSAGHSVKAVAKRLGHANPAVTLRVYAHVMPDDDDRLAEGLGKLIGHS